jgi:hypothetical protein
MTFRCFVKAGASGSPTLLGSVMQTVLLSSVWFIVKLSCCLLWDKIYNFVIMYYCAYGIYIL